MRIEAEIRVELQEPRDPEERLGLPGAGDCEKGAPAPPAFYFGPLASRPGREFIATTFAVICYGGPNSVHSGTDAFEKRVQRCFWSSFREEGDAQRPCILVCFASYFYRIVWRLVVSHAQVCGIAGRFLLSL